jgi:predicted RNase H-like HicB family nuclease
MRSESLAAHRILIENPAAAGQASRMKIKAIIHQAEEGGFWAEVPALPGCSTQGESIEELKENLKEAISLWLDVGQEELEGQSTDRILEVAV